MKDSTLNWIQEQFESSIQNFYDDPYGYAYDGEEKPIGAAVTEAYHRLRSVAEDLGFNFEEIAERVATDYEMGRMDAYLTAGNAK